MQKAWDACLFQLIGPENCREIKISNNPRLIGTLAGTDTGEVICPFSFRYEFLRFISENQAKHSLCFSIIATNVANNSHKTTQKFLKRGLLPSVCLFPLLYGANICKKDNHEGLSLLVFFRREPIR